MNQYQCPFCDYTQGSKGSVKAHITRKTDDNHKGRSGPDYTDEIEVVEVSDEGPDEQSGTEQEPEQVSSDGGIVPSDQRVSSRDGGSTGSGRQSDDCCSNPDLQGSAGDVFQLENGQYVRLEQGDKICVNCDEIHE